MKQKQKAKQKAKPSAGYQKKKVSRKANNFPRYSGQPLERSLAIQMGQIKQTQLIFFGYGLLNNIWIVIDLSKNHPKSKDR